MVKALEWSSSLQLNVTEADACPTIAEYYFLITIESISIQLEFDIKIEFAPNVSV